MKHEFPAPGPVEAYVELRAGDLRVRAEATDTAVVEVTGTKADSVVVECQQDRIRVVEQRRTGFFPDRGDVHVVLTLPERSDLVAKLGSAGVAATGAIGSVRISSGAGDISLGAVAGKAVLKTGAGAISVDSLAAESEIKAGAGTISVREVRAATQLKTGAGSIEVGRAGAPVVLKSGSGHLSIGEADTDAVLSAASGDIRIGRIADGQAELKNVSGDIRLGIPEGTPVWTDISTGTGRVRSTLAPTGAPAAGQSHVEVRARSVSGDIYLEPRPISTTSTTSTTTSHVEGPQS